MLQPLDRPRLHPLLLVCLALSAGSCTERTPARIGTAEVAAPADGDDGLPASTDVAEDTTGSPSRLGFVDVSTGPLERPIEIAARAGRIYVAEQGGRIRILGADGSTEHVAIDIGASVTEGYDQGLLGFTLHPAFPTKPYLYVTYTAPHPSVPPPINVSFQSVVARFASSDGGLTFDVATEKQILVWDHPGVNHNNDSVVFGPDGYLYISSGDGSDPLDLTGEKTQRTDNLFGKILRLDVDAAEPYAVPPSNPFANGGGRPEVFAYGLRNPWRFDFDAASKRLFVGDVGYLKFEEINEVFPGANYGWVAREGRECMNLPGGPACDSATFVEPLIVHGREEAASIVGGVVYHGTGVPELTGKYVYGDASFGYFWAASMDNPMPTTTRVYQDPPVRAVSIRLDEAGEILVADYGAGVIRRMQLVH